MVGHPHRPGSANLDHAERGRAACRHQKIGQPTNHDRLDGAGVGDPKPMRCTQHLGSANDTARSDRKGTKNVGLQRQADEERLSSHGHRHERRDVDAAKRAVKRGGADQGHAAVRCYGKGVDRAFPHPGGIKVGGAGNRDHRLGRNRPAQTAGKLHGRRERPIRQQRTGLDAGKVCACDNKVLTTIEGQNVKTCRGRKGKAGCQLFLVHRRHAAVEFQRQNATTRAGGRIKQRLAG